MEDDLISEDMVYMFHAESLELLENMEDSLINIQDNGVDKESINAIFRAAHSIKGGAGMFDFSILIEFSHIVENLLDKIRNNDIEINNNIITILLKVKDHLGTLIDSIIENNGKELYDDELKNKTMAFKQILQEYLKQDKKVQEQSKVEEPKKDIPKNNKIDLDKKNINRNEDINITTKITPNKSTTLKVESKTVDSLINLIGEMVISTANVVEHSIRINDKDLNESVHQLSKMIEELREISMKTRLVAVGDTFTRYKRVVRDLSESLDKDIELVIEGSETKLDKTVIEKISDPLIHLIRNSIDHGIETIQERTNKGKNKKAILKLKASNESNSVLIQITDDGRGLDKDKILEKAIQKGLISNNKKLQDYEIYNLIMQAGFSTANHISNISGRGVGMDVVKRNIEELRGTIEINSVKDKGMMVTIRLPLTLAIIDGFMIKLEDDFYIIPLDMLLECIELTKDVKEFVEVNHFINLRDSVLPLLDLKEFFGYKSTSNKENIVIVNFGTLRVGLIVDELLGEFQTVIKPIGKIFQNLKGISGATILGNGKVALILDIPLLLRYINKQKLKG